MNERSIISFYESYFPINFFIINLLDEMTVNKRATYMGNILICIWRNVNQQIISDFILHFDKVSIITVDIDWHWFIHNVLLLSMYLAMAVACTESITQDDRKNEGMRQNMKKDFWDKVETVSDWWEDKLYEWADQMDKEKMGHLYHLWMVLFWPVSVLSILTVLILLVLVVVWSV